MWQQLSKSLVTHTALHHISILVSSSHDLHPLFVNVLKSFCFLKIKQYRRLNGIVNLAMKARARKEKTVNRISPRGYRLQSTLTNLASSLLDIQNLFSTFSKILHELGITWIALRVEVPAGPNSFHFSLDFTFLSFLCRILCKTINGRCDKPLAIVSQYLLRQTQLQDKSTSSELSTSSQ